MGKLSSVAMHPAVQCAYVKAPSSTSCAPVPAGDLASPKNKASHSTLKVPVNSLAFPTDVSWTCVTRWSAGQASPRFAPGSSEHSTFGSAVAEATPIEAVTARAASAAKPSFLIRCTLPFPCRPAYSFKSCLIAPLKAITSPISGRAPRSANQLMKLPGFSSPEPPERRLSLQMPGHKLATCELVPLLVFAQRARATLLSVAVSAAPLAVL